MELSRTGHGVGTTNRGPARPRECPLCIKKNALSYCRPTGRLEPTPADLAYGSVALAALEYRARQGEIILLYEDETILWRFALPRAGWCPTVMPKSCANISSTSWPPSATPAQRSSWWSIAAACIGHTSSTRPWLTTRARFASIACRPTVGTLSIPLQASGG
jgi:hypothetical protein